MIGLESSLWTEFSGVASPSDEGLTIALMFSRTSGSVECRDARKDPSVDKIKRQVRMGLGDRVLIFHM
jgi:hypothetical protein